MAELYFLCEFFLLVFKKIEIVYIWNLSFEIICRIADNFTILIIIKLINNFHGFPFDSILPDMHVIFFGNKKFVILFHK